MAGHGAEPGWDAALRRPGAVVRGNRSATDGFAQRLERWVADARIDDAALERSREHWLGEVAAQEATLTGLLAELAERGTSVSLQTAAGRRQHGAVQVIGTDFVALRSPSGIEVLVAGRSIGIVRTARTPDARGDLPITADLRLAGVLSELAADRERVLIVTHDGADSASGRLQSVGHDVVVMRTDAEPSALVYVALGAIAEVTLS
ncbi:MAG: hypothetical protein ABWZ76_01325 [Acidimicrobiales bacterium]